MAMIHAKNSGKKTDGSCGTVTDGVSTVFIGPERTRTDQYETHSHAMFSSEITDFQLQHRGIRLVKGNDAKKV